MKTFQRLITYRGTEEWLKKTLEQSINGTRFLPNNCSISVVDIDQLPREIAQKPYIEQLQDVLDGACSISEENPDLGSGYIKGLAVAINLYNSYISDKS